MVDIDQIVTIVIAVIAAGGGAAIQGWINQRKTRAETESIVVSTSRDLLEDYRKESEYLQAQIKRIREERKADQSRIEALERLTDNLDSQIHKYRLVISILSIQFKTLGYEPIIEPDKIDSMTEQELNDAAASLSNIERRREERQTRKIQ